MPLSFLNWNSLRNKITALALIPALICTIAFGLLIWISSLKTAKLVGAELTAFMAERTMRATVHGYNTSIVTYGYVNEALDASLRTAQLMIAEAGGVHLSGRKSDWQALNEETRETTAVNLTALSIGSWQATPGAPVGPLAKISATTGRDVSLFEVIGTTGDLMRVAEASPDGKPQTDLSSYIPEVMVGGAENPIQKSILSGQAYHGASVEMGAWETMSCEPLHEQSGTVFGMLCLGAGLDTITSLHDELEANFVGAHGSAVVFFAHGPEKGKMLIEPTGIALKTENLWLPSVLQQAATLKDNEGANLEVRDPESGADVVVCYRYFERWDWVLVIIADSRDLQTASDSVRIQFHSLLWNAFFAALITLAAATLLALRLSKKLTDPMADLTIRLTSNATQITSSAQQQAANVASFNASGNQIAAAVKEISATSKELLRAMEQLAEDAEKNRIVANEGSKGLKGLGNSIESLSAETHSISDKLTTIREKANKINSVVTAIGKIADQTNLLSLNAAIEAEKAGESGAGFAVVAREIRRLADQSAVQTAEIDEMVEAMQVAVNSGVEQTRGLAEAMERGIAASESISGQFSDIIQRVEIMAPRYESVHQGMQNQSEGAQQISSAMWQLTEMGRQTAESVTDLNGVSVQLHEAVRILKERIIQARSAE